MAAGGDGFEVNGLLQFWQDVAAGRVDAVLDTRIRVRGDTTHLTFYRPDDQTLLGVAEVDSRRFSFQITESLKAALAEQYRRRKLEPFFKPAKARKR